jgi:hypothetical protein
VRVGRVGLLDLDTDLDTIVPSREGRAHGHPTPGNEGATVTKEERAILEAVNQALAVKGSLYRFAQHRFHPMQRSLVCELPGARTVRIWTLFRRLDIFQERRQRDGWGNTKTIGDYEGRGWLQRLTEAAVQTVLDPPDVPT